ncbi:MAG: hypothetical protein O7C75_18015 [Verrucomicrobia bacterium]|nr:hypothetical protein [Verrucomicrobiota bacterium]
MRCLRLWPSEEIPASNRPALSGDKGKRSDEKHAQAWSPTNALCIAALLKALRDKVTLTRLTFKLNSKLPTQPMPRPTNGLPVRLPLAAEASFDSGLLHKRL